MRNMAPSYVWASVALFSGINAASIPDLKIADIQTSPSFTTELTSVWNSTRSTILYHIPVTLRGEVYNLILDTGSSDTWVLSDNFSCIGGYIGRGQQPPYKCTHGPTFGGSLEGTQAPNRTYFSVYGMGGFGGTFVMGNMSYESVGIGQTKMRVKQQVI